MIHPQPPEHDNTAEIGALDALPIRVFEVEYTTGGTKHVSAHRYDTSSGHLAFLDFIRFGDTWVQYIRRTIAAGQWRQVTEITGAVQSDSTH